MATVVESRNNSALWIALGVIAGALIIVFFFLFARPDTRETAQPQEPAPVIQLGDAGAAATRAANDAAAAARDAADSARQASADAAQSAAQTARDPGATITLNSDGVSASVN